MKSHEYQFTAHDLLRLVVIPLFCLALFAGVVRLGAFLRVLPAPRPILDTDRTILIHQASASLQRHAADVVLIGDSSCLMDVSARQLETEPGERKFLNLATLSYIDLSGQQRLIQNYAAANPGTLRTVVLLMHPESLRLSSRNAYFAAVLDHYLGRRDHCSPADSTIRCWLGAPMWKGRVVSRVVPAPLPGAFGEYYGFSWDLWEHLAAERGSAVDPRTYRSGEAQGNPEYRLAPQLEQPSRAFKASLPDGVRLVIGITPSPQSFVLKSHDETCRAILRQWGEWLNADEVIELPTYGWADSLFASTTHLNSEGRQSFTTAVARALR